VLPDRFRTHSLQDARILRVLSAALDAVEPGPIVKAFIEHATLPLHERVFLLGIGKAAEPMVIAAAEALPGFMKALVITKHASASHPRQFEVMEAGHPVPDARSVMAGRAALDFVTRLSEKDLLLCLISGGGSALVTSPRTGVGLRDIQLITSALLAAGATIEEINTLRRHLDSIKGGGLARATKARVVSLLLSDVVGDRLEAIASGPTAPDPTTGADALTVLNKYGIAAPANIYSLLASQPVVENTSLARVSNHVIGNNDLAAQAALRQAQHEGFHAEILRTNLQGEASMLGERLAERLKVASQETTRPFCLIGGGETTVTIRGSGKGGRNQELALAAVDGLAGMPDVLLISLATDGDDGPTDAAGAVATGETQQRARLAGMQADDYLARNDSYAYFDALGDLLRPGYSGTNVNDLMFLFAL
jgi:glycerate 2-kinase